MATIKIVRTEEEFLALKPKWDSLTGRGAVDNRVFQTFDWNYGVWTIYHRRLRPTDRLYILHAIRDGHQGEEAIFPFCLSKEGRLEFIASNYSDVLDVVYAKGDVNWHILFADVARFLIEQPDIKSIQLCKMDGTSDLVNYWGCYLKNVEIHQEYAYSFLKLSQAADLPAALKHLPSKDRSYIRVLLKNHDQLCFKIYAKARGNEYPGAVVRQLRDAMVTAGTRTYSSVPDEALECMAYVYGMGLCEVSVLTDSKGDARIAAFRVLSGRHINFWVVLYSDAKLVTQCDAMYMSEKLKKGEYTFDWGIGVYSYKLGTFRPEVRQLYTLKSGPRTARRFCGDMGMIVRSYVRAWLGHVSPRAVRFVKMVLAFCRGDNRRK